MYVDRFVSNLLDTWLARWRRDICVKRVLRRFVLSKDVPEYLYHVTVGITRSEVIIVKDLPSKDLSKKMLSKAPSRRFAFQSSVKKIRFAINVFNMYVKVSEFNAKLEQEAQTLIKKENKSYNECY